MDYPPEFPYQLQRPVEIARDKAEIAVRKALSTPNPDHLDVAWSFIKEVFRAFASQACEAERQGLWRGSAGRHHVQVFLSEYLIPHAYDLAMLRFVRPHPLKDRLSLDEFRRAAVKNMLKSDVWTGYLEERSTIAYGRPPDREAAVEASASTDASVPSPPSEPAVDPSADNAPKDGAADPSVGGNKSLTSAPDAPRSTEAEPEAPPPVNSENESSAPHTPVVKPSGRTDGESKASPSNLANWLEQALSERTWTPGDLEKKKGPCQKTTRRILAGGTGVGKATREKLARALKVPLLDVPER